MKLPLNEAQTFALDDLLTALPATRFVLIGAAALGLHVPLTRPTADIDLAIVLPWVDFDRVLTPLGWRRSTRMLQRWHGPGDVLADLLPVTEGVIEASEVLFDGGAVRMSLVGFDLALCHTVRVPLGVRGTTIEVATLPVLVVLKMVAWLDRPAERTKDLGDLALILDAALGADDDRRWDPHGQVFQSGLDHEDQAAFFAGLEVARIAQPRHRVLIETFLARVDDPDCEPFAAMAREARYGGEAPEERLARRLAAFRRGLGTAD